MNPIKGPFEAAQACENYNTANSARSPVKSARK